MARQPAEVEMDPDPVPEPPGSRLAPRNWRVATKLYAILLIPVLVALVLGGFRVHDSYERWQEADDARATAELVRAAASYAHALIDERDVTAQPLLNGERDSLVVQEARRATDQAQAEFHAQIAKTPLTESLDRRLTAVAEQEADLGTLREQAYTDELPGVQTEERYVQIQRPLMSLANELGLGTGNVTSYGRTVYAIALAKSASSLQRSIGVHMLVAPAGDEATREAMRTSFSSYAYLERIAQAEYFAAGDPDDVQRMSEVAQSQSDDKDAMVLAMSQEGATPESLAEQGITPESWFRMSTAEFEAYRTAERELVNAAVLETEDLASAARRDMLVNSVVVLAALVLGFAIAALMARSMSRNMRRLRHAAFEVAEQRLPALVEQLSRTSAGDVDTRVAPIAIVSHDEIGEVARAFDQVHREAVRLATEQALLRGNVSAIFTNLSARNQGLIERQIALISELESHEADPEQLEHLFKLDHLATRMRRNSENLLVLAGEEPRHRWNQPAALVDVLRASASEVEAYARIELSGVPDRDVHGSVVNDLVHLLAELLENATSFSSPQTKVRVTATRLQDGRIMIEIHDKGIGLTQEDFAEINKRLAEPPAIDASVSRRMGLYVVGRLAERHNIRVQLRPSGAQSGTTCLVMLPEGITLPSRGRPQQPEEHFTVSRIVPAQSSADAQRGLPSPTAADLGFDDSRYAAGDTGRGPLGDPAPAGERRSALEARPEDRAAPGPAHRRPAPEPPVPGGPAPEPPVPGRPGFGTFPQARPDSPRPADRTGAPSPPPPPRQSLRPPIRPSAQPPARPSTPATPSTESPHGSPAGGPQRVGFGGPDPVAAEYRTRTSAGLPRRERQWQHSEEDPAERPREESRAPQLPGMARWENRGPRREDQTAGTTAAGLPRRVPQAHLTEHTTPELSDPGGPQVSRDPNDVRGRLTSLRRGVQQGRGAVTSRGERNDERGYGPGHTYDQER
ncbi:nitrate- and nitrite sensing domain-containing protein [Streptomyces sp. URMC 129]|uniref:sensor histidine kinase n=1 Tax=Streptomyces sp. URMC 129 TaxID=3423407 RepID=UPI003F1AAF86